MRRRPARTEPSNKMVGVNDLGQGNCRQPKQDEAKQELLEAVQVSDNLARAWKRVKSNNGAPGIDGVTVQDWPARAREHWPALRQQIEQGRYRLQAVRRVETP